MPEMKTFWWFKENEIAGMARPGFNSIQWLDLPFEEAVLLGWLGRFSSGTEELSKFRRHLVDYVPRIYKFHKLDKISGEAAISVFNDEAEMLAVLGRAAKRTEAVSEYKIENDRISFVLNPKRIANEIKAFKIRGVKRIVSLTEQHHDRDVLKEHFELHHIAIEDLGAPALSQARELAQIIVDSKGKGETLAVHCLAGIGRTSTMITAAHILSGENPDDVKARLKRQNPAFAFTGEQADFIESVASGKLSN
jgi:predicted protein tyrosine phosphatase